VSGDQFARAREVFLAALRRPLEERPEFLREQCGGNEELLKEVESLLAHHDANGSSWMEASTAVRPSSPAPPRRIGPYRLLQKLGEGGMGEVYEAEQEQPVRRRVAVKRSAPSMPNGRADSDRPVRATDRKSARSRRSTAASP
jgi:serine/threonine protein kinase